MIEFFRRHLGGKLFLSYLVVILVGAAVLGLATRLTVPEAFNSHMGSGMGLGTGQGMMQGSGSGRTTVVELFNSFQASFNEALLLAGQLRPDLVPDGPPTGRQSGWHHHRADDAGALLHPRGVC